MLNGRIKFAGTGNMRSFDLGNSSMLVRMSFGNVLVDCGYANYERMVKSKLIDEVEYLMITRKHFISGVVSASAGLVVSAAGSGGRPRYGRRDPSCPDA